ncbi:MAG: hypothetical protein ABJC66_00585 [Gammaproteobacteria bacterium]
MAAVIVALLLGPVARIDAEAAGSSGERYAIVNSIAGPDGMWDYAAVGFAERRLYLAQSENISILQLATPEEWTRIDIAGAMWHGVVPLESRGLILATNGDAHAVAIFDSKTRAFKGMISTSPGHQSKLSGKMARFAVLADPDALVVEPKSGLVAAVNGGSGEIVFADIDQKAVVGRVHVGGKLEFAVADGRGRLYVNVQTTHEIAVIDVPALKVVQRIPMAGCVEPKGLAYDVGTDLLISACDNGIAKFIVAQSSHLAASLEIGRGADAVMLDSVRHRAFIASGNDALLSVFNIRDPQHIALLQTLVTQKGTRLGAVDPQTGLLYLPSAKLGLPIAPHPWPSAVPGSFHVLVVGAR